MPSHDCRPGEELLADYGEHYDYKKRGFSRRECITTRKIVRPNKATAIVCTCSRTRAKPRYVILLETLAMHPDATTEVVQLCYALHQHFEMVQTDQVVL